VNEEQAAAVLGLVAALSDQIRAWSEALCREHPVSDFESWHDLLRAVEEDIRSAFAGKEG
jgi:hypothetical protein